MYQTLSLNTVTEARLPSVALGLASSAIALFGATVLVAWHMHWTVLLQTFPGAAATKYNTAACFVLCGAGVLLLITRFDRFAIVPGGLVMLVALASVVEYFTTLHFGIDQLFVRDYIAPVSTFPGRMSPLASNCFALSGLALIVAGSGRNRRYQLVLVGSLGCIVAVIAAVALLGYCIGVEAAYGWGAYSRMAARTAAAFVGLGLAVLVWAWDVAQRRDVHLSNWLPIVGSATLMTMITFVTYVSLAKLNTSIYWRKHTYEVLLYSQTLLRDITDIEIGTHRYALTGDRGAFERYRNGVTNAPKQLAELKNDTSDNPAQLPRLNNIAAHLAEVVVYAERLRNDHDSLGIEAAIRLESSDDGWVAMERTRAEFEQFTNAERRLLVTRSAKADQDLIDTMHLLVIGGLVAPALLVLAHLITGAEMNRRRRTEAELQVVSSLQTAILNAANYAIIATSVDGIVTSSTQPRSAGSVTSRLTSSVTRRRMRGTTRAKCARAQRRCPRNSAAA